MNSINFTANHIKNVNIMKKCYNQYKPCDVALVEMDVKNKNDIKAMEKTTLLWDTTFTSFVLDDMERCSKYTKHPSWLKIYALTTQKDNFEKIQASKILGVLELIKQGDSAKIETLQTNTKYIKEKFNPTPKYKHIGSELVSHVQNQFFDKELFLIPVKKAVDFYKKLGFDFEKGNEYKNTLVWKKK